MIFTCSVTILILYLIMFSGNAQSRNRADDSEVSYGSRNTLASRATAIPKKMKAVVQIGYEQTMKNKLEELGQTMEEFVTPVMAHIQAIYSDPSFITDLTLEVNILLNICYCN